MRNHQGVPGMLPAMIALAFGCAPAQESATDAGAPQGSLSSVTAMADVSPTEGNTARGTIVFTQVEGGVRVVADLSGLAPGDHGFHLHASGDCSAPDARSAGEHFNPTAMAHGGPDAQNRHIGDLGNITADAAGNARYDRVDGHLSMEGDSSIIGRAVVIHAGADDLTSQPGGNAGARVACGVIVRPAGGG